jgi:hypothetical protein
MPENSGAAALLDLLDTVRRQLAGLSHIREQARLLKTVGPMCVPR